MQRVHYLKILKHHFEVVDAGTKTCEIRKNDRAFQKGDIAYLEEIELKPDHGKSLAIHQIYEHTGRVVKIMITHVSTFMQKEDVVVLSFAKLPPDKGMKNESAAGKRSALPDAAGAAGVNRSGKRIDGKNSDKPAKQRAGKKRARSR